MFYSNIEKLYFIFDKEKNLWYKYHIKNKREYIPGSKDFVERIFEKSQNI